MAQTTGSLLRLAARRLTVLQVIVPALFLLVPASQLWGLVTQGDARDGEQEVMARVESVLAEPPGGTLFDLGAEYVLTLRLGDGTPRTVTQETAVQVGDVQRVFTEGTSVRSADERAVRPTLAKAGLISALLLVALYGGWRRFRRLRV